MITKWTRVALTVGVAAAMLTMVSAVDAGKGNGKAKGSTRVELAPRDANLTGSGWAILNTTCEGIVKANVHMDGAPAGEEYVVILVVEGNWDEDSTLTIGMNGKGVGSDVEDVPLDNYGPDGVPIDTVTVKLVVRPAGGDGSTGWASASVELPLKTLDME